MSIEPKICIVLANWNGARFLDETIQSVIKQTFRDWELIAVDTGSDDGSRAIIQNWAMAESRIKPNFVSQRLTYPTAINLGLAESKGDFIARIESDDLWLPDRLRRQLDFLEIPHTHGIGVCGTDAKVIDECGRELRVKRFPRTHEECMRAIWYRNPFCHSSVLLRRAVLESCGKYNESYACVEDLELWFRVARQWELANLPEPLVCYRLWRGSVTSRKVRTLAWRSCEVRKRAVKELGYTRPKLAAAYSVMTLCMSLLPPMLVRSCFEFGIGLLMAARRSEGGFPHGDAKIVVHASAHPRESL